MAVELRRLLVLLLVLLLIRQSARVAAQQCASVACYRDDCVDAAANAPELGGAATCEAAVLLATAAGGCTVESNSLDPSLPPGVMVGDVCPLRCGWCKCSSVACYLDSCVDAAAGAPELGAAGTCEAAAAATGGDCSIESAALDPTLPAGVPVGMICPVSCYWCGGPASARTSLPATRRSAPRATARR